MVSREPSRLNRMAEHSGANWLLRFVLLLGILVIGYAPSLDVPFYLDDYRTIEENPRLHDPTDLAAIWSFSPERFVASYTLAWNYAWHQSDVLGYHLVNAGIHLLTALALWALAAALIRSPALATSEQPWLAWVPFLAAALFLAHPLHTQAVTYIVQRYASLAALFYLGGMACYAWGRLRGSRGWFLAAVFCVLLALFSKQNALTVVAAIGLLEVLFFRQLGRSQRGVLFAVLAVALALLPWLLSLEPLDALTRENPDISRSAYFATQMGVLWRYIALFFVPVDLTFDYDIALAPGFFQADVLLPAAAHLALLIGALALWRRAPLVAFGVLFYYLAHLVESGPIPITDLAFEHRAYLPDAGLLIASLSLLAWAVSRWPAPVALLPITALLIATATWMTAERNRLWRDPIAFLRHETQMSPQKERVWTSLGKELMRRGRFVEALQALGTALNLGRTPDGLAVQPATLINAVMVLHYTRQHKKAFELAHLLPLGLLEPVERSRLHEVRGMALIDLQRPDLARKELTLALKYFANPKAKRALAQLEEKSP